MRARAIAFTLAIILGVAGLILCQKARAANWFEVQTIPPRRNLVRPSSSDFCNLRIALCKTLPRRIERHQQ
jgi:hypothetical protein